MRVLEVAPGPESHGVVRHARAITGRLAAAGVDVAVTRTLPVRSAGVDVAHVHFTDALFGADVSAAAKALVAWASRLDVPVVVTLHDVPGRDDDAVRDQRRLRAYRQVISATQAVVLSAEHEAAPTLFGGGPRPTVIPLPIDALPPANPAPHWAGSTTVGVLGFLYPGKGHLEAVETVARLGADATVVALGDTSPGHHGLRRELEQRAAELGVELLITGRLSGADLHAAARAVTVPLASYRTLGASGSTLTWLAAGRRPVARAGAYAVEVEARWPGSLLLHEAEPDSALAAALDEPASTWRDTPPPDPDVATAHVTVFREVLA